MNNAGNQLFPVFFRLDQLQMLIVGGGNVALEKVSFLFKNSDNANVRLVALEIKEEIREIAKRYPNLKLVEKAYDTSDLEGMDLAIAATSIKELNDQIRLDAKKKKILINVADTPDSCDFYLGSVIKKGDLKIAISTNGKSPTFAKRMRELLEDAIPDNISEVLDNLRQIRDNLKGDLAEKMKKLNEITSVMKNKK
ncbi:MAG: bifunctional precorrin-2 dehydrogenase/sirohydrochlorin ferrochelatase [Cytophagaceae bacterium]